MDPAQLAALKAALGPHALLLDNPTQLKAVMDSHEANKAASTTLASIKTALGTHAALLDNPAELKAAIEAGVGAKSALIDELIRDDRIAKRCADDDVSVSARKAVYAAMDFTALKMLAERTAPAAPESSIKGGDPNAAKPAPSTAPANTAPAGSPFANPAVTGHAA